jgi:hypothetical protein
VRPRPVHALLARALVVRERRVALVVDDADGLAAEVGVVDALAALSALGFTPIFPEAKKKKVGLVLSAALVAMLKLTAEADAPRTRRSAAPRGSARALASQGACTGARDLGRTRTLASEDAARGR